MKKNDAVYYKGWEIFPAEIVFTSRVTDIEAAQVVCKRTGERSHFLRFSFPDWVNVIGITSDQRMILVRQFRFGTKCVELEIPGGVINADESPVGAGCRELLEETGYAGNNARVIGKVCPNPALQDNFCHTVLVDNVEKIAEQDLDNMEDIEIDILPIDEVYDCLRDGRIHHGLVHNALTFYRNYIEK